MEFSTGLGGDGVDPRVARVVTGVDSSRRGSVGARWRGFARRVDVGRRRQLRTARGPMGEAFGVSGMGLEQDAVAPLEYRLGAPVEDIRGGEVGDGAVAMLVVVPGEELPAPEQRVVEPGEAPRVAGVVLHGLELALGEGVVVADVGAAEAVRDLEVAQQLGEGLGGHLGAAVVVQDERAGGGVVLVHGLLEEQLGQRCGLGARDHPADDVAAEQVEHELEVEVGPLHRGAQPRDVPAPDLVRGARDQLGALVGEGGELIAPLAHRVVFGEHAVQGALGGEVALFVEEGVDHLGRGAVDEALAREHVEDLLFLLRIERTRGGWAWPARVVAACAGGRRSPATAPAPGRHTAVPGPPRCRGCRARS